MALDLRPRFKAPSVDEFSRGPSPWAQAAQTGSQVVTQYLQQKKKADFAAQLKDAMASNPKLKDLAPLVTPDTVDQIIPHVAGVIAKSGEQDPLMQQRFALQQQMTDIAQQRADAASKRDDLRAQQLDMQMQFMTKKLEDMNYQMEQNRLAGIAKSQATQDLGSSKWNLGNLFKGFAGYKTKPDNISQKFQNLGGKLPPSAGAMGNSGERAKFIQGAMKKGYSQQEAEAFAAQNGL